MKNPILVRSQLLETRQAGLSLMLDEGGPALAANSPEALERHRANWRQADVRRAIAAARAAGLENYRVELSPDGTISIVVGAAPDGLPEDEGFRDFLDPRPLQNRAPE